MSRYYNMAVAITGVAGSHHNAVREAAEDAWEFGDWCFNEAGVLMASGSGNLCAGETEEEFAERLGRPVITRGSHVEPDRHGRWFADMAPVSGPCLGPFQSRSQALEAESRWLEAHWLTPAW